MTTLSRSSTRDLFWDIPRVGVDVPDAELKKFVDSMLADFGYSSGAPSEGPSPRRGQKRGARALSGEPGAAMEEAPALVWRVQRRGGAALSAVTSSGEGDSATDDDSAASTVSSFSIGAGGPPRRTRNVATHKEYVFENGKRRCVRTCHDCLTPRRISYKNYCHHQLQVHGKKCGAPSPQSVSL